MSQNKEWDASSGKDGRSQPDPKAAADAEAAEQLKRDQRVGDERRAAQREE